MNSHEYPLYEKLCKDFGVTPSPYHTSDEGTHLLLCAVRDRLLSLEQKVYALEAGEGK